VIRVVIFAGDFFLKVDLVLRLGAPILGMRLRGRAPALLLRINSFQEPRLEALSVVVVGGTCGLI
jgi:hypothetical protein